MEDTSERSGVKEGHRGAKDIRKHVVMEIS